MKKILTILASIIVLFIGGVIIYGNNLIEYEVINNGDKSYVAINGNIYGFHQGAWVCSKIDRCVGYDKNDTYFRKILYHFFPRGLYSIRNDEQHLYYQILKFGEDKNYALLVRDDVELKLPEINDITEIKFNNKAITDPIIITDIMNLYYKNGSVETGTAKMPARIHELKVYSKQYPGLHFRIEVWQPENSFDYWLCTDIYDFSKQVKIPNELIARME